MDVFRLFEGQFFANDFLELVNAYVRLDIQGEGLLVATVGGVIEAILDRDVVYKGTFSEGAVRGQSEGALSFRVLD